LRRWAAVAKVVSHSLKSEKMDIKPRPNHQIYLSILRRMTPEQRLLKAFDLSEFSKRLFLSGLKQRFSDLPETEFKQLTLKRLKECHNRNY
jgi:hypothetical protein